MSTPFTYELLEISWMLDYEFPASSGRAMHDDHAIGDLEPSAHETPLIEYDADGIPMGQSIEEIKIRENIINEFWQKWTGEHPDKVIFNKSLQENILLRSVSVIEAKEHSAKQYHSTCAFLQMEEVLSNALPVGRTQPKTGNSNQSDFESMLIMVYRNEQWGRVKVTVGIRKKANKEGKKDKVQYGMSVLDSSQPLMPSRDKNTKKKKKAH